MSYPKAFEMVAKGFVTEQDFREFTFTNAAMLHMRNNPGFFKDTVVEQAGCRGVDPGNRVARCDRIDDLLAELREGNKITSNQWQE